MDLGRIVSYVAGSLAVATVLFAFWLRGQPEPKRHNVGYLLIGFWVLAPPIWFWVEWVFLSEYQNPERLKHTHELARNIWVALVIVLAAILGIKWPKE